MWGLALAMMLWGTASGISSNFTGMMQVASVAGVTTEPGTRQNFSGSSATSIPQDFAQRVAQPGDAASAKPSAGNGTTGVADNQFSGGRQQHANSDRTTTRATWWTLATTVLSILAAVAG